MERPFSQPISARFFLQTGQAVFADELCLYLKNTALEKHPGGPVPAYYFHILRLRDGADMGWLDLRAGESENTALYGHLSYSLLPQYRGQGYTKKAVSLLLSLAEKHGLDHLYVCCAEANLASRGVCRQLGASFDTFIPMPNGERGMRFRLDL